MLVAIICEPRVIISPRHKAHFTDFVLLRMSMRLILDSLSMFTYWIDKF